LEAIERDREVILRDLLVACVVAGLAVDDALECEGRFRPALGIEQLLAARGFLRHLPRCDGTFVDGGGLAAFTRRFLLFVVVDLLRLPFAAPLLVVLLVLAPLVLLAGLARRGLLALGEGDRRRDEQRRGNQAQTSQPIPK